MAGIGLDHPKEIRKRVSYVSTTGWMGLEWPLTAEENVRFFATLCGMPTALARIRTEEALRDVDLWEDRGKYPSQLSNGMRQRVILARALLFRTPILLLDEPTVGLDPVTARDLLELIRGPLRERGQTILLTDHQSAEMEAVADHIAVLGAGALSSWGRRPSCARAFGTSRSSRFTPRRWICLPNRRRSAWWRLPTPSALVSWKSGPGVSTRADRPRRWRRCWPG